MAFGVGSVVTNLGYAIAAKRMIGSTPSQAEPKFIAMGTGATGAARTAAVTDTALSAEHETRATGTSSTVTTSVTNDTYQVVGTVTATTSRSVDEAGQFDVVTSSSGNMFTSFTFNVISLNTGDSIQFTIQTQYS